jgi:hypothetical protein
MVFLHKEILIIIIKMQKELVITSNNLLNIINWLKDDNIICLHNSYKYQQFYYSKENLESITDQEIIYVDLINWSELLDEDEWPYYIKDNGFVSYKSTQILPDKEHYFII